MNKLFKFAGTDFDLMKGFLITVLIFGLISCQDVPNINLEQIQLKDINEQKVDLSALQGKTNIVFIFISPDCPLCINYTKTIRELIMQYKNKDVTFIPVYSGPYYSKEELIKFQQEYDFEMTSMLDPEFRLVNMLDASVTPEAVVISATGEKVYSGAIDNWMYETGKKRPVITEKYLDVALTQLLNGTDPDPDKTEPIGCFIEK